jgi:hypothetical protein
MHERTLVEIVCDVKQNMETRRGREARARPQNEEDALGCRLFLSISLGVSDGD